MRHTSAFAAPAALLAAVPARSGPPARRGTPDRELGLSRTSVLDVPSPPAYHAEESARGERPRPRRISTQIPPVIPHGVADLLPITREENACLGCHDVPGPKKKGEPTPIPASHYVGLRREPVKRLEKVYGARWVCNSCHVPRSDARPLVPSRFQP
jgi:cytochrome c-type protein NapB